MSAYLELFFRASNTVLQSVGWLCPLLFGVSLVFLFLGLLKLRRPLCFPCQNGIPAISYGGVLSVFYGLLGIGGNFFLRRSPLAGYLLISQGGIVVLGIAVLLLEARRWPERKV